MRALITGSTGQLGYHLLKSVPHSISVIGMSRAECDITRIESLQNVFRAFKPDVVINAAAYTAVDRAEADQQQALEINVTGAANVGAVSSEFSARAIHISTDYVFDGHASIPYPPGATTRPLNVYGRTKLEGERALSEVNANSIIIRTGWLYSTGQDSFVGKILRALKEGHEVPVVADQVGVPTSATDLAMAVWQCVRIPSLRGVHHWVNSGTATWYDFAVRIRERAMDIGLLREVPPIVPILSPEYKSAAARPRYSVLDASATWAALGKAPRAWRDALDDVLRELAGLAISGS